MELLLADLVFILILSADIHSLNNKLLGMLCPRCVEFMLSLHDGDNVLQLKGCMESGYGSFLGVPILSALRSHDMLSLHSGGGRSNH